MGAEQHLNPGQNIPHDWWKLFQSPTLNALIERSLKNNPNLEAAQAALGQAQEYVNAQQGYFYPTAVSGYSASRSKVAGNFTGTANPTYYNLHTAHLTVGYVPDVFGANRRAVESLEAQRNAARYQMEATRLTLVSNIVSAALQEASLRGQISAQEKLVAAQHQILEIMTKQEALGYISALDVASQQSTIAQSEMALIPLKKQLELTRDLIRALAGNSPDKDVPETFDLTSLHLPVELPLSIPAKLVEQRPDVRIAEEQLHAASAQYGVALANQWWPQFSIVADVGGMASTPGWMFKNGGAFFNVAANVAYTIFDGGTLRAKSRAAQHAMEQAAAQYRATVITALQNVADTLHAIQADAEMLKAANETARAMELTRDITRKRYKFGDVSYQMVLMAEQNHQQAQITLIQAQTNRLGDTAALYQALGGGWWNEHQEGVPATDSQPVEISASQNIPRP